MKKLTKFIDSSSKILMYIACGVLCVMLLAVVVNVVGRRLFHFTIGGIIELVQYGMLLVMSLVMYRTTFAGGHVAVSIFTEKLPKPIAKGIGVFALLFAAALMAIAAYVCYKYVPVNRASGLTTDYYKIPYWLVYLVTGIGLTLPALTFVYNAVAVVCPVPADEPAKTEGDEKAIEDGKEAEEK